MQTAKPAMSDTKATPAPEFERFTEYRGPAVDGYFFDFLGTRTRTSYFSDSHQWLSGKVFPFPTPEACIFFEYHEWIGALRAVLEARNKIVAVELGAGWAPWLVSLWAAARHVGISDCTLVGVEASERECAFARQHLADNAVPENQWTLIRARIGRGWRSRSIASVIKSLGRVDLIHCDIQGAEADAFAAGMAAVDAQVARVVIGTHSRIIEDRLLSLFAKHNWTLEFDTACRYIIVDGEPRLHSDGVQVWKNVQLSRRA
jgi:hypothetical protein